MHSKKATKKELRFILQNLRIQDVEELKASHGEKWQRIAYKNILKIPDEYRLIGYSKDDKPILMYGIVPAENNIGVIWMLSTQDITKEQVSFLRQSKAFILESLEYFRIICNFVHSKNTLAIGWLEWLGFTVESPKVIGLGQKEFLFFYKEQL